MDTNKKATATMSTPDGPIEGSVKYNPQWRKFQVNIDGSLHGEFKTLEDGVEELKNAGFKNIKITENKMKSRLTPAQLKMKAVLKPIVEGVLKEQSTAGYMNKITDLLTHAASLAVELNTFAEDDYWQYRGARDELTILKLLASILSGLATGDASNLEYGRKFVKINMPGR